MEYCQELHCAYLQGLRNTTIPPVQKEPAKSEIAERGPAACRPPPMPKEKPPPQRRLLSDRSVLVHCQIQLAAVRRSRPGRALNRNDVSACQRPTRAGGNEIGRAH